MIKDYSKVRYTFEKKDLQLFTQKMTEQGYKSFFDVARKLNLSRSYISKVVTGQKSVSQKFFDKLKQIGINMEV